MVHRRFLPLLICLVLHPIALMSQQILNLDASKSEIHFTLGDPLHSVHGSFRVQDSTIAFNRRERQMGGIVGVDARSGDSGNSSRDKRMTDDELKASRFSAITFSPKHFDGTLLTMGDSQITVEGSFSLLGIAHDISVPMQVHMDGTQCRATGTFVVPYVKWGMKDPSNFVLRVGKEVTVDLILVGSVGGEKPAQ